MNVTDLRRTFRRKSEAASEFNANERRKAERRKMMSDAYGIDKSLMRVWLTPGEKNLIEDL